MNILAIESSCDDTSVALVNCSEKGTVILAEKTASQIDIHKKYGGVIPEIAGRKHAEAIFPVIEEVMNNQKKPDAIAVTSGPGLMTGLLIGVEAAKILSYLWNIPLISINHIEGHIYSTLLGEENKKIVFPAMCLIVSGGHTELILMKDHGDYELIGKTRDDAAGEAFDKVAKLLGMDYPGGPQISKNAEKGNPTAINFPRPMIDSDDFDFSFAGLKTAVLYHMKDNPDANVADVCASFEQAAVDVLVSKTEKAVKKYNAKTLILGGGVSANTKLKESLQTIVDDSQISNFQFPISKYAMDNAAMIGAAAYEHAKKKNFTPWKDITADSNWKIYEKN